MNSGSFTATVSAITDAFGDPTRRSIYLIARERSGAEHDGAGVTASEVAKEVGVHANVARHHLDKLAAGGYLEVHTGKVAGGGAGRPSKRYSAVADSVTDFPVRSDDLVLSLLTYRSEDSHTWDALLARPRRGDERPRRARTPTRARRSPAVQPHRDALMTDGIPLAQFEVDDVKVEYERLSAAGVEFTQEPLDIGTATIATFDDTCGNLIQIIAEH